MNSKMLFNIFVISFLTILHESKGADEGVGSPLNYMGTSDGNRQMRDDSSIIKPPRAIRTPFRNTEIMTARGFGKRDGSDLEVARGDNSFENKILAQQVKNEDYRDENSNNGVAISRPLPLQFPLSSNQMYRMTPKFIENSFVGSTSNDIVAPVRNHRLQIRDGSLKFRLNDGNLRIGRGFGKRSGGTSENFKEMQNIRRILNNPWLLSTADDDE